MKAINCVVLVVLVISYSFFYFNTFDNTELSSQLIVLLCLCINFKGEKRHFFFLPIANLRHNFPQFIISTNKNAFKQNKVA